MTDNILKKHVERTYPPPVRAPAGPATGVRKSWSLKSTPQRYDFETGLNDYLMEKAKPLVGKTTALALDFSEISKPFGTIGAKRK